MGLFDWWHRPATALVASAAGPTSGGRLPGCSWVACAGGRRCGFARLATAVDERQSCRLVKCAVGHSTVRAGQPANSLVRPPAAASCISTERGPEKETKGGSPAGDASGGPFKVCRLRIPRGLCMLALARGWRLRAITTSRRHRARASRHSSARGRASTSDGRQKTDCSPTACQVTTQFFDTTGRLDGERLWACAGRLLLSTERGRTAGGGLASAADWPHAVGLGETRRHPLEACHSDAPLGHRGVVVVCRVVAAPRPRRLPRPTPPHCSSFFARVREGAVLDRRAPPAPLPLLPDPVAVHGHGLGGGCGGVSGRTRKSRRRPAGAILACAEREAPRGIGVALPRVHTLRAWPGFGDR